MQTINIHSNKLTTQRDSILRVCAGELRKRNMTQSLAEIAKELGTNKGRLSEVINEKYFAFALTGAFELAVKLGFNMTIAMEKNYECK